MSLENLKIIYPYLVPEEQCPLFVQAADIRSFFGWGIRKRTKSNFNHSMIMRVPAKVVTQAWTYAEIDIKAYMTKGNLMKFWRCVDITEEEKKKINDIIKYDLSQPWYRKLYDVPGVIGHLFGMRWFNVPMLNYCSERVEKMVRVIIPDIGRHQTPEDIDTIFKNSKRMIVEGYFLEI